MAGEGWSGGSADSAGGGAGEEACSSCAVLGSNLVAADTTDGHFVLNARSVTEWLYIVSSTFHTGSKVRVLQPLSERIKKLMTLSYLSMAFQVTLKSHRNTIFFIISAKE